MRKLLLIIIFIQLTIIVNSQTVTSDTSIYTSKFERKLFDDIRDSVSIDPIRYFAALKYNKSKYDDIKYEIKTIENSLKSKGIDSKPIKKQVKLIYKKVHFDMLRKYSEDAFFFDITSTGTYNCVTASAVYAIILDNYGINYSVKERPSHVYLVVNPNKDDIIMESTNPNHGVLIIDDKAKRDYIKYLRSSKLISEEEYEEKSVDELFKMYFNDDKSIDIRKLAGLQYYNKGVQMLTKELYNKANPYFEKGLILYPESKLIRYYYNSNLSFTIVNQFSKDIYDGRILGKYIHLNASSTESLEQANNSFSQVTEQLTMQHPNIKAYTNYYNAMMAEVPDTVNLSKFNRTYHFYKAYYLYVNHNYDIAMEELRMAYEVNPEDIRTKQLIHDNAIRLIVNENNIEATVDTFDYYLERHPYLLENKDLQNIYVLFHYGAIAEAYERGDEEVSANYWKRTREMFEKYDSLYYAKEVIENFYSDAYYHYNARYKKTIAKKYLNEGLKMFPESEKLKKLKSQSNYKPEKTNAVNLAALTYYKSPEEKRAEFKEDFTEAFTGCWEAVSSYQQDKETIKTAVKETYKIQILKSKTIKFYKNKKMLSGKWSMRTKSKLLYLIPDMDKNDYDLYKIIKVTETELHLRMYKNRKKTNTVLIFKKCS